jgi:hypothetical protein
MGAVAARALFVMGAIGALSLLLLLSFAANGALASACPNETLRAELGSGRLPDCRAYERVTPSFKEGEPVQAPLGLFALSTDGNHLLGWSFGAFAGTEQDTSMLGTSSQLPGAAYEFTRSASGWGAYAIGPPQSRYRSTGMYDTSADLQSTLWGLGTLAQTEGLSDLYLEHPRGTFTEIGPATPEGLDNAGKYLYEGASENLSHVLFSVAPGFRWSFDETSSQANTLYEYVGTGNSQPALVGVGGDAGSTELVSHCGTLLGSSAPNGGAGFPSGPSGSMFNAVSTSGARIFFTAVGTDQLGGCQGPAVDELLAREEVSPGTMRTVSISEPSTEDCATCDTTAGERRDATFQGASADGSLVFFTTEQQLLPGAAGENLYEYDFDAPTGQRVMLLSSGAADAEVQGVARISEDGSHVYFIAKGVLTAMANQSGDQAVAGADNLYVYERDPQFPAGRVAFVATLAGADTGDWASADDRPVQSSANGDYLIFTSVADLTHEDIAAGEPQIFQYNALTGGLARASIGQQGYNDDDRAPAFGAALATQPIAHIDSPTYAVAMSAPEDGAVFFQSPDALTPQALDDQRDADGQAVPNVYEYEAGNVYLLSDGRDTSEVDGEPGVRLLGADPSGGDVFFTTSDPLIPADGDTQQDIYDARAEGGFSPSPSPSGCEGEACHGELAQPPVLPVAGSAAEGVLGATPESGLGATPMQAPLGIENFRVQPLNSGEAPETQAGAHPYELRASISLLKSDEQVKDLVLDLPPGLLVNPLAASRCPLHSLQAGGGRTLCPPSSQVGTLLLKTASGNETAAVYNMEPEPGYPLELGVSYLDAEIVIYGSIVHGASGDALSLTVPGLASFGLSEAVLTLFGDPSQRDGAGAGMPLLTNPVNCAAGSLSARLEVDTWLAPGDYQAAETTPYPQVSGCEALQFQPTLTVNPETTQADEPAGYTIDIENPQNESPLEPGTPELKRVSVTLPPGVSLSPAAADGLHACAATGPEGINLGSDALAPAGEDLGNLLATELGAGHPGGDGSRYDDGLYHASPGLCPDAATVGTVEITTPLLPTPLEGHLFLAVPACGGSGEPPCVEADAADGRLFGVYLEAAGSGVIVKVAGVLSTSVATGQLTLTFDELPQLPFSDLRLHFSGGPRALLANPQMCGPATSEGELTPWGAPTTPVVSGVFAFTVDWNGAGGACPAALPLEPTLNAGTLTPTAGSSSPFTLTISRGDRQQELSRLRVQLPPGLEWLFSDVPLCAEAQASSGTCGEASEIGTTQISIGAGSHPFWLSGHVYLSGPYRGTMYGLSITVPLTLGPWNLGNLLIRSAVAVEPASGALTLASDPLPRIVDGLPLRIQTFNLFIDRPGFVVNPGVCAQSQGEITATVEGAQGALAEVANPFMTTGCQSPLGGGSPGPVGAPGPSAVGAPGPSAQHLATGSPKPAAKKGKIKRKRAKHKRKRKPQHRRKVRKRRDVHMHKHHAPARATAVSRAARPGPAA